MSFWFLQILCKKKSSLSVLNNNRLYQINLISQELQRKLAEETDAKERAEGYLKELQTKHEATLSELEDVQSKLHNKEDYCVRLQASAKNLGVPEILLDLTSDNDDVKKVIESTSENSRKSSVDKEPISNASSSDTDQESIINQEPASLDKTNLEYEVNQLKIENVELQNKIDSGDQELQNKLDSQSVLISTYIDQVEKLDKENTSLKEKLDEFETITVQFDELDEEEKVKLVPIVEQQVKKRLDDLIFLFLHFKIPLFKNILKSRKSVKYCIISITFWKTQLSMAQVGSSAINECVFS